MDYDELECSMAGLKKLVRNGRFVLFRKPYNAHELVLEFTNKEHGDGLVYALEGVVYLSIDGRGLQIQTSGGCVQSFLLDDLMRVSLG